MIYIAVKELMQKSNISRYRLQQLTNWNYRRINALYFSTVKNLTLEEIEVLCDILNCDVNDLIKRKI
jgi:DNA-binding Xre family transcriptional regulator